MSVRNDFWLWGQVPNSHHEEGNNIYNLPGVNKMTPIEGAKFFGIKNICMVVMEDKPAVRGSSIAEKNESNIFSVRSLSDKISITVPEIKFSFASPRTRSG